MNTTQWIVVAVAFCALISLALALIVMGGRRRWTTFVLQLFGFTVLSATLVWYALSWPRPSDPASSVIVGDRVAVNSYSVETRSSETDSPWRADGEWLIGGRD